MKWHFHRWRRRGKAYLFIERETKYAKLYAAKQDRQCAICGLEQAKTVYESNPPFFASTKWFLNHEVGKSKVKFDPIVGIFLLPPVPPTPRRSAETLSGSVTDEPPVMTPDVPDDEEDEA